MAFSLYFFLMLAFTLGIKHAYDADHLVAVSNFLTRAKGIRETIRMTISWAMGHMLTASILTITIFFFATQSALITSILSQFEILVAIMLIFIGTLGILFEVPIVHKHYHRHLDGKIHLHIHKHRFGGLGGFTKKTHLHHPLLGIGIIHGIASNDELFVLFVLGLGVGSLNLLLGGVAIFTIGVFLGMILFGILISLPLLKYGVKKVQFAVNLTSGSLSILYGCLILIGLGGFNPFELMA
jgi:hypothetical protein